VVGFLMRRTELGDRVREFLDMAGGGIGELGRVTAWKASLPMVSDFRIAGVGFGAFGDVFQRYLPSGNEKRWQELHNDYLEVLIEGGFVGALLVGWLAFAFWHRVLRPRTTGSRGLLDLERAGLLLGLASISVHAFIDFNHQVPANALVFVGLAGIAMAAAETRGGDPE
jgi:O-antigen ligase